MVIYQTQLRFLSFRTYVTSISPLLALSLVYRIRSSHTTQHSVRHDVSPFLQPARPSHPHYLPHHTTALTFSELKRADKVFIAIPLAGVTSTIIAVIALCIRKCRHRITEASDVEPQQLRSKGKRHRKERDWIGKKRFRLRNMRGEKKRRGRRQKDQ